MQQIAIIAGGATPEPDNESWSDRIARAAEASVWGHDLQPAPLRYDLSRPDTAELMTRIEGMGSRLVGVIVFNQPALHALPTMLDEIGMPWVTINRMSRDSGVVKLCSDAS